MVRAGAVGTHLPTSSLDIFGDLRKMNKRQCTIISSIVPEKYDRDPVTPCQALKQDPLPLLPPLTK